MFGEPPEQPRGGQSLDASEYAPAQGGAAADRTGRAGFLAPWGDRPEPGGRPGGRVLPAWLLVLRGEARSPPWEPGSGHPPARWRNTSCTGVSAAHGPRQYSRLAAPVDAGTRPRTWTPTSARHAPAARAAHTSASPFQAHPIAWASSDTLAWWGSCVATKAAAARSGLGKG